MLIFDGDCSFCRRWIARWHNLTGDAIEYQPYQRVGERFPHIARENFGQSVHLVEPDGMTTRAAEAVFRTLSFAGRMRGLRWMYEHLPPFRWLTEFFYALIAGNRNFIDKLDQLIIGVETRPTTYVLMRSVFLRGLGVIYLIAFWSLFVQIDGLIGSNGILPAGAFLDAVKHARGLEGYWLAPTLGWLSSSDASLHALCIGGMIVSCLLIVGVLPMLSCLLLWAGYLSLTVMAQDFLSFQWDALLLETGFLAILFAPPLWLGSRKPPSRIVIFLLRWLLFRLMFLSAAVKWLSGDAAWHTMKALHHHFETQPLPPWTSWYAHNSPQWLLATGCFLMFVIEGIIPLLYLCPRRLRILSFWPTVFLQLLILATGNYGFFNLLALLLAIPLLDDVALQRLLRRQPRSLELRRPTALRAWMLAPIALFLFSITTIQAIPIFRSTPIKWPTWLYAVQQRVQPFRSTNNYGLFAIMTTDRPEIIIEGSDDGQNWKAYAFKWKPGDVTRRPRFCVPHMPRLDWQMWFEALSGGRMSNWFVNLQFRLLEGRREVLDLLAENPFPGKPPRYVRAVLYDYRFSDRATKSTTGAWWVRKPLRLYLAPVTLQPRQIDESFRL
jgi:predicted DCC family thiol-disulfide oxidoreductase YuxK